MPSVRTAPVQPGPQSHCWAVSVNALRAAGTREILGINSEGEETKITLSPFKEFRIL